MLNVEKWKDDLLDIAKFDTFGVVNDKPVACGYTKCEVCEIGYPYETCDYGRVKWLTEESEQND